VLAPLVDQVIHTNGLHPNHVFMAISMLCEARTADCDVDFINAAWGADLQELLGVDSTTDVIAEGTGLSLLAAAGISGGRMGGRRGCGNSFEEGTLVLMADGTYKPIEDVEPGDIVLATNPLTGTTGPQPVLATIESHGDKALVEITIHDQPNQVTIVGPIVVVPHGQLAFTTTVVATGSHPFWNPTTTAWINADNLQPGGHLLASDGTQPTITNLLHHTQPDTTVYNLTITTTHTYYVLAGDTPVLVHNDGGDSTVGTIFRSGSYSFQIYSNDHGPGHGHLKGNGYDIQLGQNGKPLDPNITLTKEQQQIVDDNIQTIRKSVGARMAAFKANGC
jgi:hypothetical protein